MVIRLSRISGTTSLQQTGLYRCEIPGARGVNIIRSISIKGTGKYFAEGKLYSIIIFIPMYHKTHNINYSW